MVGIRLILVIIFVFFCADFAEALKGLEKEEALEETEIEPQILEAIKQFEKEKQDIIKERRLKSNTEPQSFRTYTTPASAAQPIVVSEKNIPKAPKLFHKKKNFLFDAIFFSIIIGLFFTIKFFVKPAR